MINKEWPTTCFDKTGRKCSSLKVSKANFLEFHLYRKRDHLNVFSVFLCAPIMINQTNVKNQFKKGNVMYLLPVIIKVNVTVYHDISFRSQCPT